MALTARDKRRQKADAEDSSSCTWRRVEAEAEVTNVSTSAKGSTLTQTIKATEPAPKTPQL
jgi:hypothetical protein